MVSVVIYAGLGHKNVEHYPENKSHLEKLVFGGSFARWKSFALHWDT